MIKINNNVNKKRKVEMLVEMFYLTVRTLSKFLSDK